MITTGALLITGTVGAGKTTTADAVGRLLAQQQVPHGVIDLDAIRRYWPASDPDDPFDSAMELTNLRDVARNYRERGARRLVIAGVIERREDRDAYQDAAGLPLVVCRLTLDLQAVRARLVARHDLDPDGREWHLHRSGELDAILTAADVADATVPVDGADPLEAARRVLSAVGWG